MPAVRNGHSQPQTWLGAVDVGYLTEAERDVILSVLQRDERIRKNEQERISKLKTELRDVKRKGAKNAETSYSSRVCARCNSKTGIIFNMSSQCPVCKHKVCSNCMVSGTFSRNSKCIVCYQETKLKAETGEWFFGIMRPELRSLQDGSTVVKQAVLTKPIHFDERQSPFPPEITCTPASSNSQTSSKKGASSVTSCGTEGTGSSTESRKQTLRRDRHGPAETGSIESLRKDYTSKRAYSIEPESNSQSPARHRRSKTLPMSLPPSSSSKPEQIKDVSSLLLAHQRKQQERELEKSKSRSSIEEINTHPFLLLPKKNNQDFMEPEDRTSDSSIDSRSIDGAFEDYFQRQREERDQFGSSSRKESYRSEYEQSLSHERSSSGPRDVDDESYIEEAEDEISQLPPPQISTLPRKLNEKLLKQNRLSASVPTVYNAPQKKQKPTTMNSQGNASDTGSMDFPVPMTRNLSTSVPNLSRSNTSLNSTGLHDLTITGEIKFSLSYNYKANFLLVNVVECQNIATADRKRKRTDAYVKCYLLPDRKNKQKTDVKKRTTNPVYNKCLKFSVSHSELSTRVLELSVWHAGTFTRNLFLGQVQVPLDTWDWDSKNPNWFPLRQKEPLNADFVRGTMYKGDLVVGLKFIPMGAVSPGRRKATFGELHVHVKEAKNLTPVRSSGTVDAFVKIVLHPDKQFRQKTAVIPKSASPEWNYNLRMQLMQPIEESSLQFTVWHKDKLQGSTLLGGCRINLGPAAGTAKWMDATGMEKALWQAAIDSPGQWIDQSLQLRASL